MVYLQVLAGFVLLLGGAEFLVRGAVAVAAAAVAVAVAVAEADQSGGCLDEIDRFVSPSDAQRLGDGHLSPER